MVLKAQTVKMICNTALSKVVNNFIQAISLLCFGTATKTEEITSSKQVHFIFQQPLFKSQVRQEAKKKIVIALTKQNPMYLLMLIIQTTIKLEQSRVTMWV